MSKFKKKKENIPENYFSNLEDKIKDVTSEEELFNAQDFPILYSIKKQQEFTLPKDYFSGIKASKYKKAKRIRLSIYYSISIAAMIMLAVSIFTLSQYQNHPTSSNEKMAMNIETELDVWDQEYDALELSDLEEIQSLLDDDTHKELQLNDIENNLIINYLLDESDPYDLALVY